MGNIAISYIGDLTVESDSSTIVVDDNLSYVASCRAIESALQRTGLLEIFVRKRNYYAWLQSFMAQIGEDAVFSEKTARDLLKAQWDTTLPSWVTDTDILSQKLLDVDIGNKAGKPFERILLSVLLDPIFDTAVLDTENTGPIINLLIGSAYSDVRNDYPIIDKCLREIANQWRNNAGNSWVVDICDCIPEKVHIAWSWITAATLLNSYPKELLERILPIDQAATVRKIPDIIGTAIHLEPNTREEALTQINLFFDEITAEITSISNFRKLIDWVSGHVPEEFQRIEEILQSGKFEPTEEDISLVQEKFQNCPGIVQSKLQSLKYIIRPPYPTLLEDEEDWSIDQWIQWTVNEYIPYREWQVRNNVYDGKLERMVARFSDWYVDSYMSVQGNTAYGLPHILRSVHRSTSEATLTVILLIDCLPINYASILENVLRQSGFHRHQLSYRFSALPTVTEYNKGAIITGELGAIERGYKELMKERTANDWGEIDSYYVSTVKELSELRMESDTAIVLVNFNDGDEILHSDVESKNRTYEEELSRSYSALIRALADLCGRWTGKHENVTVIVSTDHGACRILDEERQSFDSTLIQKLFADEKYRMANVTEEQAEKVPSNLWDFGYRFKTPFSEDDAVHFLPRGHNTVRKPGNKNTYMHGGVSPEEVIVPFSLYGMLAISWKKLFIRPINLDMNAAGDKARFYIQRTIKVELEVQNPNTVPVTVKKIEVSHPATAIKGLYLGTISASARSTISIDLYFQKESLGADELIVHIRYEISGEEISQDISVPSEFRSAMSGGFNLRDLTNS